MKQAHHDQTVPCPRCHTRMRVRCAFSGDSGGTFEKFITCLNARCRHVLWHRCRDRSWRDRFQSDERLVDEAHFGARNVKLTVEMIRARNYFIRCIDLQNAATLEWIAQRSTKMARYGKAARKTVKSAMRRKKQGTLRSGKGGKGGRVKSRKQAIAIGLSEARKKGAKVPAKL